MATGEVITIGTSRGHVLHKELGKLLPKINHNAFASEVFGYPAEHFRTRSVYEYSLVIETARSRSPVKHAAYGPQRSRPARSAGLLLALSENHVYGYETPFC